MSDTLTGWSFPFRIVREKPSGLGGVGRASETDKIAQNLRHLLGTRVGERTMLRSYGGGVQALLQEPNNETTRALFKHDVEQALAVFMPDARLTAPLTLRADQDSIEIVIEYVASPAQVVQRLQLTFPSRQ
jgi:phage baseplate assembly protein W